MVPSRATANWAALPAEAAGMPVMLSRHANLRLLNADHRRLTRAVQRRPILTRLQEYRSNHAATCRQLHDRHTKATSQRAVARQKIDGFNREIGETVCQIRTLHQPLTHLPRSLRGDRAPARGTMPANRTRPLSPFHHSPAQTIAAPPGTRPAPANRGTVTAERANHGAF